MRRLKIKKLLDRFRPGIPVKPSSLFHLLFSLHPYSHANLCLLFLAPHVALGADFTSTTAAHLDPGSSNLWDGSLRSAVNTINHPGTDYHRRAPLPPPEWRDESKEALSVLLFRKNVAIKKKNAITRFLPLTAMRGGNRAESVYVVQRSRRHRKNRRANKRQHRMLVNQRMDRIRVSVNQKLEPFLKLPGK